MGGRHAGSRLFAIQHWNIISGSVLDNTVLHGFYSSCAGNDAFTRRHEIGLHTAVTSWAARGEVRDSVHMRHLPVRRTYRVCQVGIARIGDADIAIMCFRLV